MPDARTANRWVLLAAAVVVVALSLGTILSLGVFLAPIQGATGEALCSAVREHGHREARYLGKSAGAGEAVRVLLQPGDIFLTMGAGDVWKLGESLLPR